MTLWRLLRLRVEVWWWLEKHFRRWRAPYRHRKAAERSMVNRWGSIYLYDYKHPWKNKQQEEEER